MQPMSEKKLMRYNELGELAFQMSSKEVPVNDYYYNFCRAWLLQTQSK